MVNRRSGVPHRSASRTASRVFASRAAVVWTGRDQQALAASHAALAELGCAVMSVRADISDLSSIAAMFEEVSKSMGRVDILINNAGVEEACAASDVTSAC